MQNTFSANSTIYVPLGHLKMAPEIRSQMVGSAVQEQLSIRRKKKISVLIYAIVSIGFLLQMYNLLSLYLHYAVSYQTKFEKPVAFTLPAVFVCVQFASKDNESMQSRIENAMSVSDLVKSCKLLVKNGTLVNCGHVTQYSRYYDSSYLCIGLLETDHLKVHMDTLTHLSDRRRREPLIEIAINTNPMKSQKLKFIIGVNGGQLVVTRNSDSIALCSSDVISKMAVTFSRTHFTYLQAPYVSKCIDYEAVYQAKRDELINRCIISNYASFPHKLVTSAANSAFNSKPIRTKVDEAWLDVMLHCGSKYPMTECTQYEFTLDTKSRTHSANHAWSSVAFDLHRDSGHDVVIREQPKINLFYLSINMGGVLSLWLGLSVFDLQATLVDLVCYKFDKNQGNIERPSSEKKTSAILSKSKVFITMICLLGCTLHCHYDICRFLEKPFITESFILKPQRVTLPSVTICLKRTINWTRAPSYFKRLKEEGHRPEDFMLLKDFLAYSPQFSEVFWSGTRFRQAADLRPVALQSRFEIKESVGRWRKCFTFFSDVKTKESLRQEYVVDTLRLIDWTVIIMATQFTDDMTLIYHEGHDFESSLQDPKVLYLPLKNINYYRLSYDLTAVKFIADHRMSTCFDYMTSTSRTRMENIRDCSLKMYNETYPGYLPLNRYAAADHVSAINAKIGTRRDDEMRKYCSNMFRKPDCANTYHVAKLQKSYFHADHVNTTRLELNIPFGAAIHFNQELRMQFVELLCYLGSLVGVYLGLSVYAVLYLPASVSGEYLFKLAALSTESFGKR
ncbi:hypothetical protein HDE_13076 [Halotydeus destructor]|nr:hypothetical protein HDE_13076 [Halotydeus destructor]